MNTFLRIWTAALIAASGLACSNSASPAKAAPMAITYEQLFASLSTAASEVRTASIRATGSRSFSDLLADHLTHEVPSVQLGDATFEMSADKLLRAQQVAKALDQIYPNLNSFLAAANVDSGASIDEAGMIATIRGLTARGDRPSESQEVNEFGLVSVSQVAREVGAACFLGCAVGTVAITAPIWVPVYLGTAATVIGGLSAVVAVEHRVEVANDARLLRKNPPPRLTYKPNLNTAQDVSCHQQPATPAQCAQGQANGRSSAEGLALGSNPDLPEEASSALTVQSLAAMGQDY